MLHITTESFTQVKDEVRPLLQAHWDETETALYGAQNYTLNEEQYNILEGYNMLHISTARHEDGQLCGYAAFNLTPCYHRANALVATLDGLFLHPAQRQGLAILRLLRHAEQALKERGARFIQYVSPASRPCESLYTRLGATHTETVFCKEVN